MPVAAVAWASGNHILHLAARANTADADSLVDLGALVLASHIPCEVMVAVAAVVDVVGVAEDDAGVDAAVEETHNVAAAVVAVVDVVQSGAE